MCPSIHDGTSSARNSQISRLIFEADNRLTIRALQSQGYVDADADFLSGDYIIKVIAEDSTMRELSRNFTPTKCHNFRPGTSKAVFGVKMGVGAIKVDFGEGAPSSGVYASGRTGFYEHNLYPLRYNKAVADITKEITGDWIIWARSAWAGSQRYPLHWERRCREYKLCDGC